MRVLVTGGGSDVGRSIVKRRMELGDEVVITSSSTASLEAALVQLRKEDVKVAGGFVFDLAAPEQSQGALSDHLGRGFDALVMNAWTRTAPKHRLHEVPDEEIDSGFSNVFGYLWLLKRVLPGMVERELGRIVLISSVSASTGTGRYGIYVMAKSAMEGLIRNLAVEYGRSNVLANTVQLGFFKTSRTANFWSREWYVEKMSALIPQGRFGEPGEIGAALDPFLAKEQYANGSVLALSGGFPVPNLEKLVRS